MKQFCVFALALMLLSTLTACGCSNNNQMPTTTTAPTTRPTVMPTTDPTIYTNIPDPSVDTSMPDFTDGANDNSNTDSTLLPGVPDGTSGING